MDTKRHSIVCVPVQCNLWPTNCILNIRLQFMNCANTDDTATIIITLFRMGPLGEWENYGTKWMATGKWEKICS